MKKPIKDKLKTKLNNLLRNEGVSIKQNKIFFKEAEVFSYSNSLIQYGKTRVAVNNIDPFYEDDYEVCIILGHDTLKLLSGNLLKPPSGARVLYGIFGGYVSIKKITIGSEFNSFEEGNFSITRDLYSTIVGINKEEGKDKVVRVKNRTLPFLGNKFDVEVDSSIMEIDRNYTFLLEEIIANGKLDSKSILALTKGLEAGEDSRIVIKQEVHKQTDWLLKILREIIDYPKFGKLLARQYGSLYFNYLQKNIAGPEHLMEKILSDYGKNILFGVPALFNTDKYVVSQKLPRVQFDILLIDNLSDIQVVELKRTDAFVLDYDVSRNKFYPTKDLSVAIGQSERYITTLYKDNDLDFKIKGQKIKDYIHTEVGGNVELNVTRPSAIIIIGAINRLAKEYDSLNKDKRPSTRKKYQDNLSQAYRELRNTHKNIKIITYSELVEGAELRLTQS